MSIKANFEIESILKSSLQKHFLSQPISVLLLVTKAGSDCCEPLFKATVKDEEEMQEVTAHTCAAKEISVDPVVFFTIK